ncbi:MAG TPA: maleylpyruvate isomerase N-terminal domain-containing protein, partial [Ilumatobacteraceae bacterium]
MAVLIDGLITDLRAETDVLLDATGALTEVTWRTPTPAEGWTIHDQLTHLAFFDTAITTAVLDPARFRAERESAMNEVSGYIDNVTAANRDRTGDDVLGWFRGARVTMIDAFSAADSTARVPWFGPDMSLAAALTSRIMETWAHGQDVFDALGAAHPLTSALRQVAHLGVRALPNSFITLG